MKNNIIIDCFAGGGGASVGIEMALGRYVDIAVNHDPEAIRIHTVNHPNTLHLTEDIFKVDLQKYVNGRHVALMWASPDCTSYSKAKLEAVEAGISTVEREFFYDIVLPDGRTAGEWMAPQIKEAYQTGQMPVMLPMFSD